MTTKSSRRDFPSGWMALTQHPSVIYLVDALMDEPATRWHTKSDLAEKAGISRQSVGEHIDLLVQMEIVETRPVPQPATYRFNPESEVGRALIELDGAIIRAGESPDET